MIALVRELLDLVDARWSASNHIGGIPLLSHMASPKSVSERVGPAMRRVGHLLVRRAARQDAR